MAKDKMMQQASWEKKKEKLDKKKDRDRGSMRTNDKIARQNHKEVVALQSKEAKTDRGLSWIGILRVVVALLVFAIYVAVMMLAVDLDPTVLTAVMLVTLTGVCFAGAGWQAEYEAAEERRRAAALIEDTLERKQSEKDREQQRAERSKRQLEQLKERVKRQSEDEKASLQQAKELCRALRARREEREAEELRAQKQAAAEASKNAERDAHGWTAMQLVQLREAATKFPDGWAHAKTKKRWEMIAAEVDDQDARSCEATLERLEHEARTAQSDAKAAGKAAKAQSSAAASQSSAQDDLDWLGDDNATTDLGDEAFDDTEDEDEEDEEEGNRDRMAIELEPEHRGTEIRLDGIKAMQGCATVQVEVLHLQLSCADCRTAADVYLSGADEDSADAKLWCDGCTGMIAVRLRPTLLHRGSKRLCYVDCTRCNVTDVLPSVLMSVCEGCDAYNVHKQHFARNKVISGTCFSCHSKYGFGAESIQIEQITPCAPGPGNRAGKQGAKSGDDDPMEEIAEELRYLRKKAKTDPRQQCIVLGRPLPQNGACKHFKKSYKWFRFACCGRAFPCPQCHIESDCPAAALGAHATRMICGKCSMEQSYSPSNPCEKCNFAMIAKGSSHWNDGGGTRNITTMSTKDAKKFKGGLKQGTSKFKTTSAKADRVGVNAKKAREHQQKFGKD